MSTVARSHITIPHLPAGRARGPAPTLGPGRTPRHFLRRRLALAGGILAVVIAAVVVLVTSGSGPLPPATGAATIVPADALAYVNLSTDPARPAVSDARKLAARFPDWPLLETAALNRLRALVGGSGPADFATAIRPWLGKEAALALIA